MAKKNVETEIEETAVALEPVTLKIKREHLAFPHSIELRRNGGEFVVEARTEDHRHSETLGAKTIEQILQENGASTSLSEADELTIAFSPHNGAIIVITPGTVPPPPAPTGRGKTVTPALP